MSGLSTKAAIKRELLDTVKVRKLAYYGLTMRKQGNWLEKEIMQGTMPGARRRGRPRTAWIDNIKSWTGFSVEESIRMTGDRDKWRKYVHGVATLGSRTAKEQNKTETAMNLSVLSCLCLSLWLVGWSLTSLFSTNTAISKTCCYNH